MPELPLILDYFKIQLQVTYPVSRERQKSSEHWLPLRFNTWAGPVNAPSLSAKRAASEYTVCVCVCLCVRAHWSWTQQLLLKWYLVLEGHLYAPVICKVHSDADSSLSLKIVRHLASLRSSNGPQSVPHMCLVLLSSYDGPSCCLVRANDPKC